MFRWGDTRWTPRAAKDLSLTLEQVREEMYKPWPHGMRNVMDSQIQSSATSAVTRTASATDVAERRAARPSTSRLPAWSMCALPVPSRTPEELVCIQPPQW